MLCTCMYMYVCTCTYVHVRMYMWLSWYVGSVQVVGSRGSCEMGTTLCERILDRDSTIHQN